MTQRWRRSSRSGPAMPPYHLLPLIAQRRPVRYPILPKIMQVDSPTGRREVAEPAVTGRFMRRATSIFPLTSRGEGPARARLHYKDMQWADIAQVHSAPVHLSSATENAIES